jgi:hypothetical protein
MKDLDERARHHYVDAHGEVPPKLSVGDQIADPDNRRDLLTVVGFRSGGMLVDCVRPSDGQEFCQPRFQDPGGFLRRVTNA